MRKLKSVPWFYTRRMVVGFSYLFLFLCFMQRHYRFPTVLGLLVRVEVGTASILVLQGNAGTANKT